MITEKDVQYVAGLARIHLSQEEIGPLTAHLEQILGYVNKLNALDVNGVQATSHVLPLKNVTREDTVKPSLTQKESLKISVEQFNGSFKVPKVID